jgi:hypothetical protein
MEGGLVELCLLHVSLPTWRVSLSQFMLQLLIYGTISRHMQLRQHLVSNTRHHDQMRPLTASHCRQ